MFIIAVYRTLDKEKWKINRKKIPLSSGRERRWKRIQQFKVGSRQATTCGARTTLPKVKDRSFSQRHPPSQAGVVFSVNYNIRFNRRKANSRAEKSSAAGDRIIAYSKSFRSDSRNDAHRDTQTIAASTQQPTVAVAASHILRSFL